MTQDTSRCYYEDSFAFNLLFGNSVHSLITSHYLICMTLNFFTFFLLPFLLSQTAKLELANIGMFKSTLPDFSHHTSFPLRIQADSKILTTTTKSKRLNGERKNHKQNDRKDEFSLWCYSRDKINAKL